MCGGEAGADRLEGPVEGEVEEGRAEATIRPLLVEEMLEAGHVVEREGDGDAEEDHQQMHHQLGSGFQGDVQGVGTTEEIL